MPEDTDAEHPVAGIDHSQAGIGNDHKNGVLAGLSVIILLIEMVSAEAKGMVYFDVLFGNHLVVLNYPQSAYIIANNSAIAQRKFIFRPSMSAESLEDVFGSYLTLRGCNLDLQCRINAGLWVVDNFSAPLLDCNFEILERP